jgi:hypothetical protein
MKRDTVPVILVGLLCVSSVVAAWLAVRWFFAVRETQDLQMQFAIVNNIRVAAQSLSNEAVAYGRKNPAIEPLLQEFSIRAPSQTPTNQPPAKPNPK